MTKDVKISLWMTMYDSFTRKYVVETITLILKKPALFFLQLFVHNAMLSFFLSIEITNHNFKITNYKRSEMNSEWLYMTDIQGKMKQTQKTWLLIWPLLHMFICFSLNKRVKHSRCCIQIFTQLVSAKNPLLIWKIVITNYQNSFIKYLKFLKISFFKV